jgi:putative lumazine-binding protein
MTAVTTTATPTTATTPDYDEIVRVVHLYIDGWKGDVNKFKEAFHEDAWIFFTDADGVLHKDLLTDCFERWAATNRHIEGRIISVTQAGDVASVLLGWDNSTDPSRSFVDFHALLRINGVWKITNKTTTHSSRAAWAKA